MTKAQKHLLDRRFQEAAEGQPAFKVLQRMLLRIGGTHLVAPPGPEPELRLLIEAGFVMPGPVMQEPMVKSDCHRNVAEIWSQGRHGLVALGTGYALSDDGLWRQHSWGIRRGGILETTVVRAKYFGVLLRSRRAEFFVMANFRDYNTQSRQMS